MPDQEFKIIYTRRSLSVLIIHFILILTLIGRLFYLQEVKGTHYQTLSDRNRIESRPLIPARGTILDARGEVLAYNRPYYRILLSLDLSNNLDDLNHYISEINKFIPITQTDRTRIHAEFKNRHLYLNQSIVIQDHLSVEALSKVQLYAFQVPGLSIETVEERTYHCPPSLGHILGYVGKISKNDMYTQIYPRISNLYVGKNGLEKQFDLHLLGKPGVNYTEVNSRRHPLRVIETIASEPGETVQLFLHTDLHAFIETVLEPYRSAVVVVMNPKSGAIYALVSKPGYNTNLFVPFISSKNWKDLLTHPDTPLMNRATQGCYAPGSTFKMVVALAALRARVISNDTHFSCPGYYNLGSHRFHCWKWRYGGHGRGVNLRRAIAESCDVYFYNVALLLKSSLLGEMAELLGLNHKTGIELPGEKKGNFPNNTQKGAGYRLNLSIGQGALLATPLQLVRMISVFANGGSLVKPRLVQSTPCEIIDLSISKEDLRQIQGGLNDALNHPSGTAFKMRPKLEGCILAGKTGTTQVKRMTMAQRKAKITGMDIPYEERDHALFVGYTQEESPRFAISVLIEHGMSGGRVAADVASRIIEFCTVNLKPDSEQSQIIEIDSN